MSELKDYRPETVRKHWTDKVKKALIGKTITDVQYMSDQEVEDNMWYKTPVAIQLDNKHWIVPMADDEGNDGGSMYTNIKGIEIIPVL